MRHARRRTAIQTARKIVDDFGLYGRVDIEALAARFGIVIDTEDFLGDRVHEITIGRSMAVRSSLSERMRRWVIAHGLGHFLMHQNSGNHVHLSTDEPRRYWNDLESEAEAFAHELMVGSTILSRHDGLNDPMAVASEYGVPLHKVDGHPLGGLE